MSVREERIAAADRLTGLLARITGTAEHPSGLVTVTASATGALRAVRLHPAALGQGPDAVGRLVVETARLATDAALRTSYNELAKTLGDSVAMAVEDFAGPPPPHRRTEPPDGPRPASGSGQPSGTGPGEPTAPPWGAARPRGPQPARPRPAAHVEDDEDDFFADPFRGQRR
ncbi:YbaB/EbfC family nucleoid-associated protein [Actinosynnema sp. NPDC023587]|uniref:YbaB/EbfC family nucleoid-associated protein n=1 Tax=Actinosynnema sp. NPDC023587 TaxID=3154695 RepID=UPI0033E26AC5